MVLGLLPSIRGGLGELAKTGQHSRLIEGYLRPYARAFDEVRYFSYLREALHQYVTDTELLARVRLLPGGAWHPWVYGFLMPIRYAAAFRGCAVLRVFQVLGTLPAVLAKRRFGVPYVTTYGFWYGKLARSRTTRLLRRIVENVGLRSAQAVIVTTPEIEAYISTRIDAARIHLIPNGVDTTRFVPVSRPWRAKKRVLYVGRLSEEKNLDTLIEATAKLLGRFDIGLTLVGEGPLHASLDRSARERRVPVEFIPVVEHGELPRYLQDADAFVLPSLTEGHPKVLLEAMSAGVPCVASDVDGSRAVLTDGETGLLFDPLDACALASHLERLLTDLDLARRIGARARAAVLERYDLSRLVEREIALLIRVATAH
ncbi:MAG: glycosyltransferase family 4 protein [Actinobacteria bacterium]|nr:MAG: glycosyltransferase family 4 protein [Actinomycetota bacterium]